MRISIVASIALAAGLMVFWYLGIVYLERACVRIQAHDQAESSPDQLPHDAQERRNKTDKGDSYAAKFICDANIADYTVGFFTLILALATSLLIAVGLWQGSQIKRTVESAERAEAPYLIPETRGIEPAEDGRPMVVYTFRNHGKSVAIIRRFQDRLRAIPALPEREDEIYGDEPFMNRPPQYIPVGPGHVPLGSEGNEGTQLSCRLNDGERQDWGHMRRYLVTRVQYDDLFGNTFIQAFCIQFVFEREVRPGVTVWQHTIVGHDVYNYRRQINQA